MCIVHPLTVKFALKFGEAEMAEMAVRGRWYSAPRIFLGAVVITLVTVRGWYFIKFNLNIVTLTLYRVRRVNLNTWSL